MNILLSIIVPYYDCRDGLVRLVESISDDSQAEIIIINDSTENLDFIFSLFPLKEIHLCSNDNKRYAGSARNKGLSLAKGKWVIFADPDDFFEDGAFQFISEYYYSDFDIIFFDPVSVKSSGEASNRTKRYSELLRAFEIDQYLTRLKFYPPWSKLYKKSFIVDNSIKFDEVIASNDVIFSLVSGLNADKIFVDLRSIYCVVEREGSLTKNKNFDVVNSRAQIVLKYNEVLKNNNLGFYYIGLFKPALNLAKFDLRMAFNFLVSNLLKGYPLFNLKMILRRNNWL